MLCYRQIISISVWETEALILTHKPAFCLYQGRIQDVWGSHDTRKAPQRTLNLVLSIIGASKRTHAVFLLSMGTPREEIIKASLHSVNKNGLKNKNVYTDIIQITNSTRKYFMCSCFYSQNWFLSTCFVFSFSQIWQQCMTQFQCYYQLLWFIDVHNHLAYPGQILEI